MKYNKLFNIVVNILNNHSPAISNFLISFIVIKYATVVLWGELAYYMTIVQLMSVLVLWGSKDYLLKEFSLYPSLINGLWQNNTLSRLIMLLSVSIVIYFVFPFPVSVLIIVWLSALFISKSYDVFIYYYKSFTVSLFFECLSLLMLLILILWNRDHLDIENVLSSYMYSGLLKALLLMVYYRKESMLSFSHRINIGILVNATPFFVLAFLGILNTRVDVFCINYFMTKEALGYYQIFFSFLLLIQGLGYLLIEPFSKNVYRLSEKSFKKIRLYLILISPVASFIGVIFIYLILTYFYKIEFSFWMYLFGFLFCMPQFMYSMIVYKLFKFHYERWVIYLSVFSIMINVILNFFTIPIWGLIGVMFSAMLVQWGKLLFFTIINTLLSAKLNK
jgi:O-antigen/teichoic acid export membrane protein